MRTIALEEHFATEAFMEGPGRELRAMAEATRAHPKVAAGYGRLLEGLSDLGEGRIAAMDEAGVDVQVLSLTSPGVEQLDSDEAVALAHESNDRMAEAVRRYPERLAGFAALPTPAPEAAAEELERAVRELGFVGAIINGHAGGRYLDDHFFWPILERADALGVPVYLHPTPPPRAPAGGPGTSGRSTQPLGPQVSRASGPMALRRRALLWRCPGRRVSSAGNHGPAPCQGRTPFFSGVVSVVDR